MIASLTDQVSSKCNSETKSVVDELGFSWGTMCFSQCNVGTSGGGLRSDKVHCLKGVSRVPDHHRNDKGCFFAFIES